jgi:hypothetical protein
MAVVGGIARLLAGRCFYACKVVRIVLLLSLHEERCGIDAELLTSDFTIDEMTERG